MIIVLFAPLYYTILLLFLQTVLFFFKFQISHPTFQFFHLSVFHCFAVVSFLRYGVPFERPYICSVSPFSISKDDKKIENKLPFLYSEMHTTQLYCIHRQVLILYSVLLTFADKNMDGINQWTSISEGGTEMRNEFVYNIFDLEYQRAAIRYYFFFQHSVSI